MTQEVQLSQIAADKRKDKNHVKSQGYLETWNEALRPIIEMSEEVGCSAELPRAMQSLFDRAVDQGWGKQGIGALINTFKIDKR